MKFIRATLISFLISVVTLAPVFLNVADAGLTAKTNNSSGTLSVSTGTFILYAAGASDTANTHTTYTLGNGGSVQHFYIINGGSFAITAFSLSVTDSSSGTITLTRCPVNTTYSKKGTCTGGITPTSVTPVAGTVTLSIPVGSWYEIEFNPQEGATAPIVSVAVSSSQIRSPIITNS